MSAAPEGGRVVVTGAGGGLGRVVVADLAAHGWSVLAVDRTRPPGWDGDFVQVDLTDYGQVLEVILGGTDEKGPRADAVVHLAAVPSAGLQPNAAIVANNAPLSYNVFQAARQAGVRNVVWASSETLLGIPFETPPPYLPLDEEYRVRPESAYSLVKALEEEMAHHFCRWNPELTMTGLRFSNVMSVDKYEAFPAFDADPSARRWNMWGYIDARDGAQAVRLSLQRGESGVEVFIIANADTVMSRPSAELAAEVYPGVEIRKELAPHETLLSIDKARRLLGYDPQHSWRAEVGFPPASL